MRVLALLCVLTWPAMAGEYAVLASGMRLHVERHENAGNTVHLFTETGEIEMPASEVVSYEEDDYVPPAASAAVSQAPTADPSEQLTPQELVERAARRAGLPPEFVQSVAAVESGFKTGAVSPKGAIGIMQLMPGTAAALSVDPRDPKQNTEAGAMYLRELLIKYDHDAVKALAAYNAGPGAVDRYKGLPPYRETQWYVERVLQEYIKRKPDSRAANPNK